MTFPQVLRFGGAVPFHADPYFSMWRLAWVAHAIAHAPQTLFDANIFFPERHTLAYSDAMLLPGIVLAPLFWAGVNPVAIYNGTLLSAFVLSALAMFALVRRLTDSTPAALVGGTIYAFAPSRFTHYNHLELQLVFWIPLVLLIVHHLMTTNRARTGVLLGAVIGLQLWSSIYACVFMLTYCAIFIPCVVLMTRPRQWRVTFAQLAVGGSVAVVMAIPYALAYQRASGTVGTRSLQEVGYYSASLKHYVSAPQINRLYGTRAFTNPEVADEMNLFPGVVAIVLTLVGIVRGRSFIRFAYVVGLVVAVEITRGANSAAYLWLFQHVAVFRGLRSAARAEILVLASLAALSGYGVAFVLRALKTAKQQSLVAGAILLMLIAEYASAPVLIPAPMQSRVDALLAKKPGAVIVELPLVTNKTVWGSLDWIFMYQGIPHLHRMLNGYSGYAPPSYLEMRNVMSTFPDDRSMSFLRSRGVNYVVVRLNWYDAEDAVALLEQIESRPDLSREVIWMAGSDAAALFSLGK